MSDKITDMWTIFICAMPGNDYGGRWKTAYYAACVIGKMWQLFIYYKFKKIQIQKQRQQ